MHKYERFNAINRVSLYTLSNPFLCSAVNTRRTEMADRKTEVLSYVRTALMNVIAEIKTFTSVNC